MLKQDTRNYRIHSDNNKELIKKSVDELGAGRSILIDANNEIIAGNGVAEQWGNRPIKIIETNGDELIVVKRIDLKQGNDKRRKLAILDNSTSDSSEFDYEMMLEDLEVEELGELGIDLQKIEQIISNFQNQNNEINDITKVESFSESINFIIKCESVDQLKELQNKLHCDVVKLSYEDFIKKLK